MPYFASSGEMTLGNSVREGASCRDRSSGSKREPCREREFLPLCNMTSGARVTASRLRPPRTVAERNHGAVAPSLLTETNCFGDGVEHRALEYFFVPPLPGVNAADNGCPVFDPSVARGKCLRSIEALHDEARFFRLLERSSRTSRHCNDLCATVLPSRAALVKIQGGVAENLLPSSTLVGPSLRDDERELFSIEESFGRSATRRSRAHRTKRFRLRY